MDELELLRAKLRLIDLVVSSMLDDEEIISEIVSILAGHEDSRISEME